MNTIDNLYTNDACFLCPNLCGAARAKTAGRCGVTNQIKIAKYYLHRYEEPIISGEKGAGTVFFCGCSLQCAFCQNYEVSRNKRGKTVTVKELAEIFKRLEEDGAATIDLVTPTQYSLQIAEALDIYKPKIPVVYNTHGYERTEVLEIIDKYVDIYLPDLKYYSPARAKRYCGKENYFAVAIKAIEFMIKRKPIIEEDGKLKQGVIVRHLVLPENLDETGKILTALKPIIGDAYLSIMSQYTPFGKIDGLKELQRKITRREYARAVEKAESLGFEKVFLQEFSSQSEEFIPDWDF
ncbi:MAG TPA: radical SAM protein [Clostridiales bacterium]|nr:radical SAM protein [Clostridiales bacterium]